MVQCSVTCVLPKCELCNDCIPAPLAWTRELGELPTSGLTKMPGKDAHADDPALTSQRLMCQHSLPMVLYHRPCCHFSKLAMRQQDTPLTRNMSTFLWRIPCSLPNPGTSIAVKLGGCVCVCDAACRLLRLGLAVTASACVGTTRGFTLLLLPAWPALGELQPLG